MTWNIYVDIVRFGYLWQEEKINTSSLTQIKVKKIYKKNGVKMLFNILNYNYLSKKQIVRVSVDSV